MRLNRRSLLGRAIGLAGLTLIEQKVPAALAGLDSSDVQRLDRGKRPGGLYIMERCLVVVGDASQNDPDWIEDHGDTLILRDKVIQLNSPELFIPGRNTERVISNCRFDGVTLKLGLGRPAYVGHCYFSNLSAVNGIAIVERVRP